MVNADMFFLKNSLMISNRLPHYTEIVSGTVIMHGCAVGMLMIMHAL